MKTVFLFYVFYAFCFGYLSANESADTAMLQKIENLEIVFNREIQLLKRTIWIEVTGDIDQLKDDVLRLRSDLDSMSVRSGMKYNNKDSVKGSLKEDMILDALRKEKYVTRNLRKQILVLQKQMDSLIQEMAVVTNIKENIDKDVEEISLTLSHVKPNLDWLEQNKDEILVNRFRSFRSPSFVSPWLLMKSQDGKLSEMSVKHGLNALPYKVEVLVKPMDGPNAGWIFNGDSAFRNDDDLDPKYGGVVYFYDESKVILFAPKKNNNFDTGHIVYTGSQNSRRLGNNHQESNSALVRVKVWGQDDLPSPDFETEWLPLDIKNKSLAFYEIDHGLNDYPALISVQVKNKESGQVSDGVSSSVMPRLWLNAGGTIWGFNNKSVRIWSACEFNGEGNIMGKPFGGGDGWGKKHLPIYDANTAKVKVIVWSNKHINLNQNGFIGTADPKAFEFGPIDGRTTPTDADIVTFFVEATNGPNEGYRFKGYGSSQAKDEGFGGSVFAYNKSGFVRSWPPNPEKKGHLIHIAPPYGNGKSTQTSDDAVYVFSMIKTWP